MGCATTLQDQRRDFLRADEMCCMQYGFQLRYCRIPLPLYYYLWYAIIPSGSVTNWNDWAECGVTLPDPQIRDKC
jgi:hypothetical protein